ncbi:MAG: PEP/pyruvate-binding domain-containing protein [Bacteroidota bacterium]
MSKLSQLEDIHRLGLPGADFIGISWQDVQSDRWQERIQSLQPPFAVRSTFADEDSLEKSYAGHFDTRLNVQRDALLEALHAVFASYPNPDSQYVIVQEMIAPAFSGVLFAYRKGVWKMEWVEGLGENLVSGKVQPDVLLLPHFQSADLRWRGILNPWQVWPQSAQGKPAVGALMNLSVGTQKLLDFYGEKAPHGLDIEFSIDAQGKLFILQSRPITTPEEQEEVLTSANHKEILPPKPSRLMTSLIASCSQKLFAYYQRMDPQLDSRDFIVQSAAMPWINLSALLDVMIEWGLPTALVCKSVGAEDFYRVGLRPYRILRKLPVFFRVLNDQRGLPKRTKRWIEDWGKKLDHQAGLRKDIWQRQPEAAFAQWFQDLQQTYVGLVSLMQALTGAMSGPSGLLNKLGLLQKAGTKSQSTEYLEAYQNLSAGELSLEDFLRDFGHRGFYESDLGQKRFSEWESAEWENVIGSIDPQAKKQPKANALIAFLIGPVTRLIHTREWLRHESMRFFTQLRLELLREMRNIYGEAFDPFAYPQEVLSALLSGDKSIQYLRALSLEPQSGWDIDTFIHNQQDRRLPLSVLSNIDLSTDREPIGLGIYPGIIEGQIWQVEAADQGQTVPFEQAILLTESLDPGWIPYFVKSVGVLSYVGGILSHASIILRESQIPAITQLPRNLDLKHGDWVRMDGKSGKVEKLSR